MPPTHKQLSQHHQNAQTAPKTPKTQTQAVTTTH